MIKKWLCLPLLFILFIFCSHPTFGQDTKQKNAVADTATKQENRSQYFKPVTLIIPGTFAAYVALKPAVNGIRNLDNDIMAQMKNNHPNFHTHADDYLMWEPSASLYVMDAFKVKTKHSFKEHLLLDAGSIVITGGIGYVMRQVSGHITAYNSQGTKFPSGHIANAFRGAEIIHQELKDNHKLLSYSGYLFATSVGVLRIYNKDHLFTEVLAGAALGMLSTKLTYWIFDKVKYKKKRY